MGKILWRVASYRFPVAMGAYVAAALAARFVVGRVQVSVSVQCDWLIGRLVDGERWGWNVGGRGGMARLFYHLLMRLTSTTPDA
jgi:hypothetical protein